MRRKRVPSILDTSGAFGLQVVNENGIMQWTNVDPQGMMRAAGVAKG